MSSSLGNDKFLFGMLYTNLLNLVWFWCRIWGFYKFWNLKCRVKGLKCILDLGPNPRTWMVRGGTNSYRWFLLRTSWMRHEWEDGPRRNTSSDKLWTTPVYILIIKVTFQEAPVIGTCIINVHHKHIRMMGTQKYLRESYYYRIECTATTSLAAFMWRKPLNSVALATTTHKKPKRVSDGTGT